MIVDQHNDSKSTRSHRITTDITEVKKFIQQYPDQLSFGVFSDGEGGWTLRITGRSGKTEKSQKTIEVHEKHLPGTARNAMRSIMHTHDIIVGSILYDVSLSKA